MSTSVCKFTALISGYLLYLVGHNLDGPKYGKPLVWTAVVMDDFKLLYVLIS